MLGVTWHSGRAPTRPSFVLTHDPPRTRSLARTGAASARLSLACCGRAPLVSRTAPAELAERSQPDQLVLLLHLKARSLSLAIALSFAPVRPPARPPSFALLPPARECGLSEGRRQKQIDSPPHWIRKAANNSIARFHIPARGPDERRDGGRLMSLSADIDGHSGRTLRLAAPACDRERPAGRLRAPGARPCLFALARSLARSSARPRHLRSPSALDRKSGEQLANKRAGGRLVRTKRAEGNWFVIWREIGFRVWSRRGGARMAASRSLARSLAARDNRPKWSGSSSTSVKSGLISANERQSKPWRAASSVPRPAG